MTDTPARRLLISLISSAPANLGKGLRMARKFRGAGWDVTLLVTVGGVHLLTAEGGALPCPVQQKPLAALLSGVIADGCRVLVGGECLGAAGLTPADLPEGVTVASLEALDAVLVQPDLRIMTW
jgi:predicted peroxiredoxin